MANKSIDCGNAISIYSAIFPLFQLMDNFSINSFSNVGLYRTIVNSCKKFIEI